MKFILINTIKHNKTILCLLQIIDAETGSAAAGVNFDWESKHINLERPTYRKI